VSKSRCQVVLARMVTKSSWQSTHCETVPALSKHKSDPELSPLKRSRFDAASF